jgi:superfamily II DNA or RNA helicase
MREDAIRMEGNSLDELIGRKLRLPGHFVGEVKLEGVRSLGGAVEIRVRTPAGMLDETILADDQVSSIVVVAEDQRLADAADFFDFIEAHRIQLAYAHDPNFAVSMTGIRGLPHQIIAVYRHMLPQTRLRFVLADDPGAGKTIMAGLLMKELQLRGVADRVLILCPAPLVPQWQAELAEKFDEHFEIFDSRIRWAPGGNPWQRHNRVIASVDFAKRDEIMRDLLRADWDLAVIDEAHKCSATSRWDPQEQRDRLDRTQRYRLAEQISGACERLLLMTATPHSGDPTRFQNFLKLLDPDQFAIEELSREQIAREDSPYFLRRQKEGLKDERGADLFVPREVLTQPFDLTRPELRLYEEVTAYIRRYLGQQPGRKGGAVALARIVLQRRLASSLGAIRSSLDKRAKRIAVRIEEIEATPQGERQKKLAELRLVPELEDEELGPEDATEESQDIAAEGIVVAETLDQMRAEIVELERLARLADQTIDAGEEAKLSALKDCLERAELAELRDGRGKLLIFTEHRDTLDYLVENLRRWDYDVCSIHGGLPPTRRREIQQDFRLNQQICVATEAAGEGINLQFCHLMINYDLPWNPVRLEQRMGRIHRIGQESKCWVFNFCAGNTIEGMLLLRLLQKLEQMEKDLGGRVYDIVGEVLEVGGVDFEGMLRDALLNPERLDTSQQEIDGLDPEQYREYEKSVGIAQATQHVDVSWVRERDWRSEERRLMPEYVEQFFVRACEQLEMRIERRADGLWRVENVPQSLRSDRLASVKRLGRPEPSYRKFTFRKEERERAEHEDAALVSPGHPLYAAAVEVLDERLIAARRAIAHYVAPWVTDAFAIHFFAYEVRGQGMSGEDEIAYAELVAIGEEGGEPAVVGADVLHDLTPIATPPPGADLPTQSEIDRSQDFVKVRIQDDAVQEKRRERTQQAEVRRRYLVESMDAQSRVLEAKWSELDDRVYRGEEAAKLARDEAQRRLNELERRREEKLTTFDRLGVVRPGAVAYLGSALVGPAPGEEDEVSSSMRNDREVEALAMAWAEEFERRAGWEPEDVSGERDGRGFDVRSVRRDEQGRVQEVRRIEVKGRSGSGVDVSLCRTEWLAAQRHGETFWLYVVYDATGESPRGIRIQNPAAKLGSEVSKVTSVTAYHIPGRAIEEAAS